MGIFRVSTEGCARYLLTSALNLYKRWFHLVIMILHTVTLSRERLQSTKADTQYTPRVKMTENG